MPPGVSRVGQQQYHQENRAEHVAALGDPGDRLDPQRVNGEQKCHQDARPKVAGHPQQCQQKQHRRRGVQDHGGQMVAAGPLADIWQSSMCDQTASGCHSWKGLIHKCPAHPFQRQPAVDVWVFEDIFVVIVIEKLVADRAAKDQADDQDQ